MAKLTTTLTIINITENNIDFLLAEFRRFEANLSYGLKSGSLTNTICALESFKDILVDTYGRN